MVAVGRRPEGARERVSDEGAWPRGTIGRRRPAPATTHHRADPARIRTPTREPRRGVLREYVPFGAAAGRAREARDARDGFGQDGRRAGRLGAEPLRLLAVRGGRRTVRAGRAGDRR